MAEKNEELEQIKQMTSAEQMLESIEGRADPFAGYTLEELQSIAGVINGFGDSKAKEAVVAMLKAEIDKQQNNQQPQEQEQPTPADAQEQQPATSEAPVQDNLKDLEFITEPSYSQYKAFESLHSAALKNELNDEQINTMEIIVNNAQKAVASVVDGEITPESAVSLKDYINILRDARTFEADEKEKMDALETKVDAQLKIFDEENGLDKLEGVSAEELEKREDTLHQIATSRLKAKFINKDTSSSELEDYEIIKNLAIQEMKTSSIYPDEKLYKEIAESIGAGATPKDIEDIFNKGISGAPLSDVQQEVFDTLRNEVSKDKEAEFDEKFEDLKEQFEATKLTELAKIEAEEVYPITSKMSQKELEEILRKRAQYIADSTPESEADWIEKNALCVLRAKYPNISDADLLERFGKEFEDTKKIYESRANVATEATKVAYALKVDMLANRSARLTNSADLNKDTKKFLGNFAKAHPNMYAYGKVALVAGKKAILAQIISKTAGLNGLAVYSAYNTYQSFKKSYNKYLEEGGEKGFKNFVAYLRKPENYEKRIDLLKQASITGVAIGAAVVGNVTGMGIAGSALAPVIKRVATGIVSAGAEGLKTIKAFKDLRKAKQSGDKEAIKTARKKFWKGALIVGATVATLGVGYGVAKYFSKDDGNDDMTSDLANNQGNTGKPANLFEGQKFFKSVTDENGNPRLGDSFEKQPMNTELKGVGLGEGTIHIGAEAPKLDDVNAGNSGDIADAAQATAEVPALSENDINLLKTDCKMGPDPIVAKLQQMGVLSDEDKEKLIGSGGRKDGVASRVLASYLGHPYDNTEVPVHANLTAEQQQELNQFLRSDEYQQQCDNCNAAANARRIASLRGKINGDEGAGGGDGNSNNNGNGFHFEKLENQNSGTPVETKYAFEVSQRKKAIFNIVNKSMNPEQTSVDLSTKFSKEQLAQMSPEQIEKASMEMAAYQYIQEHGVKRAEIVDKDGNVHTYYRKDLHKDGDEITKRVDRTTDGHKVTTKVRTSGNGATLVKYSGKEEQVTYTDEHGNKVNIGGEGEDKVKRVVVDPTTGKEYKLVKGDDGKMYTLEKDMKTGRSTVSEGGTKGQMNRLFKNIKKQTTR